MDNIDCVSFAEFDNSIKRAWKGLQREEDLCDLTLACEGGQIRAHKLIISSMSPVLSSIIKQNLHPNPIIYLKGVKYEDLQSLLNYIYQGEVSINLEDIDTFFEVAKDLNIQGMSDVKKNVSTASEPEIQLQKQTLVLEKQELINDYEVSKKEFDIDDNFEKVTDSDVNHELVPLKGDAQLLDVIEKNIFICKRCNYEFEEKEIFQNHLSSSHQEKWFPCNKCTFYATQSGNLKAHKRAVHGNIFYSCNECGIQYKKKDNLTMHINSIHKKVCYQCEKCDYKSDRKSSLKIHVQSIHEGILYPCYHEGCNFKAIEITQLKRHTVKVHDGIRYPCQFCEYKATQKGALKVHIESIHTGIRYPCEICGYKATEKGALRKHILKQH